MNRKPRLVIISDLWGTSKTDWKSLYIEPLQKFFELRFYNAIDLAEIQVEEYRENILHQLFVNGGMDTAVERLLELEMKPVHIMGFSVGGTIAWRYSLRSKNILSLYCLSSTRLRKETSKPTTLIHLSFGELDSYKPDPGWADKLGLELTIVGNQDHEFYSKKEFSTEFNKRLLQSILNQEEP